MSHSGLEYLRHILSEADYLINRSKELSRDEFMRDETVRRAFVRSLEVIGEATKQVPDELRSKYSHVEWRAMAGMRDRLIHGYFGVDYDIVWDVVINKFQSCGSKSLGSFKAKAARPHHAREARNTWYEGPERLARPYGYGG